MEFIINNICVENVKYDDYIMWLNDKLIPIQNTNHSERIFWWK